MCDFEWGLTTTSTVYDGEGVCDGFDGQEFLANTQGGAVSYHAGVRRVYGGRTSMDASYNRAADNFSETSSSPATK